jgi:hypothetical protein
MRKTLIGVSLALAAAVGIARAEVAAEAIPADFIQQFVQLAAPLLQQQFPNPPVKVDINGDKTTGYHVQEMVGLVVMPDKNVSAKAVEEAADKEVPVALIATKSLSVEDNGQAVNGDKLAQADVAGMFKLPVFFVSVKAKGEDRTLEIYSKENTAVASVPLKKQAGDASVPVGLKLTNIDLPNKKMDATISVAGAYEGTVKLAVVGP